MPKNKHHLFFDLDHTIWDFKSNSRKVLQQIYTESVASELTTEQDFLSTYRTQNSKFWDRYRKGYISADDLRWKRFWHTMLIIGDGDVERSQQMGDRYLELLQLQTGLISGAREILDWLEGQDYSLHIITNGFEEIQKTKMEHSDLMRYFDTFTSSEEVRAAKPNPKIFARALEKADSSTEQALMIGDSLTSDIRGAIDYGMDAVFYNPYEVVNPHEDKTTTITDLRELKEIL